jgi:hypothetical protein
MAINVSYAADGWDSRSKLVKSCADVASASCPAFGGATTLIGGECTRPRAAGCFTAAAGVGAARDGVVARLTAVGADGDFTGSTLDVV